MKGSVVLREEWGIMRNMTIGIMMLDGLGREVGAMTLYSGMPVLMYDMMIPKLDCGIDAMTLDMKMCVFVCGMIV